MLKAAQKTKDSLAKAKEEQLKLDAIKRKNFVKDSTAKAQLMLKAAQRTKDSIAKAKEEQLKLDAIKRKNFVKDSIAKAQLMLKAAQRSKDSIAKAKEEQLKLDAIKHKNFVKDSIARAEQKKHILNLQKRKEDSIAKIQELKQKEDLLKQQKFKQDSIAKVLKIEMMNSIKRLEELKRKEEALRMQKLKQDSIAKALEIQQSKTTSNNSKNEQQDRFSCKYQLNEFDNYFKVRIIKTEAYTINEDLTIELYKKGQHKHVFFNLSEDLGCASYLPGNRSSVRVTLQNNQTITFYHTWNMDCGNFRFKGRLTNSQIKSLQSSPIKSIKLNGTKLTREITTIDYNMFFIDKLGCIE